MSAERLEKVKQRVRAHTARRQQEEGRRQSLQEQRDRHVAELEQAGYTPDMLPSRVEQIDLALASQLIELEQTLTAAGA